MSLQSTLKALADPIRRDILNLLKEGRCLPERSVRIFL